MTLRLFTTAAPHSILYKAAPVSAQYLITLSTEGVCEVRAKPVDGVGHF